MTVMTEEITLDIVLTLARQLRPIDKARLMTRLAPDVEAVLEKTDDALVKTQGHNRGYVEVKAGLEKTDDVLPKRRSPSESVYGILADLGPGPSAEDIDEVRREMWASLDDMEV